MVIQIDPSARMQVRSLGELQPPASCYVCGSGNCEEGYLDFGTFIDYHGSFYLCMTCSKQAAETIGCYLPEEVKTTQALMETIVNDRDKLEAELDEARVNIDSLSTLLASRFIGNGTASIAAQEHEQYEQYSPSPLAGSKDRESETPKPAVSTRRKHVTRTSSSDSTK